MPSKIFSTTCGVATLALGFVLSATPAHAGFQWNDPKDAQASQDPYGASGAVGAPESIIGGGSESGRASANYPSAPSFFNSSSSSAKDNGRVDLSSETISMANSPGNSGSGGGDVVQGFASQVPLALALHQILPADHNFSIDQGVDMNTLVSYKGGRPWPETLKNSLASVGLEYHQVGNVVNVSRASAASLPEKAATQAMQILPSTPPQPQQFLQPMQLPKAKDAAIMATPAERPSANVDGWTVQRGETLRKVLTAWCGKAGVELKWLAEYDYPVEASAHYNGGFEEAVRSLFAGFDGARPQPIGELHVNPRAGQDVLVVQARGNSYTN